MSEDSSKFFEKAIDKKEQVVYNALTDRQTDDLSALSCKAAVSRDHGAGVFCIPGHSAYLTLSNAGVFCAGSLPGKGYCALPKYVPALFYPSEYLCRVIGFSGEAAFVVAKVRACARRFCGSTVLCVPGVRDHAHPVILPRLGRADAFRFSESGVAA